MDLFIVGLLLVLVLCVLMVIVLLLLQNRRQNQQMLDQQLQKQDQRTRNELQHRQIQETFQNLNGQLQVLRKEGAAGSQAIQRMYMDIQNMNRVMTQPKMRGNWGEYQLQSLLEIYAGENSEVFSLQYTLGNGKIADAILHVAGTDKVLCIDSKFPVENYLRMEEEKENKAASIRLFKTNMKKHIDDVASKYITAQTVEQAVLFIPSESIYQFVCAQCSETLSYALNRHVLLTSPTTLVGVIFTLLASTRDFYRSEHIQEIEQDILSLQEDAKRLAERSQKAEKSLENLVQQFHSVSVSAAKITKHMDKMMQGREESL